MCLPVRVKGITSTAVCFLQASLRMFEVNVRFVECFLLRCNLIPVLCLSHIIFSFGRSLRVRLCSSDPLPLLRYPEFGWTRLSRW